MIFRTEAEDWLLVAVPRVTEETLQTVASRAVALACQPGQREVKPAVICEDAPPEIRNAAVRLRIPLFAVHGAMHAPEGLCGICGGPLSRAKSGPECPRCRQNFPSGLTLRTCPGCLTEYVTEPGIEEALHEKLARAGEATPYEALCPGCRAPAGPTSVPVTLLDEMAQALASRALAPQDLQGWGLPPAYLRLVNLRAQRHNTAGGPRASP